MRKKADCSLQTECYKRRMWCGHEVKSQQNIETGFSSGNKQRGKVLLSKRKKGKRNKEKGIRKKE